MGLVQLVCFSRAVRDMSSTDINDILAGARARNRARGVTGALCYESRWFLTLLEGPREAVNPLYLELAGDRRHVDLTLLGYRKVTRRSFPGQPMANAGHPGGLGAVLRERGEVVFAPQHMAADEATALLERLGGEGRDAA